MSIVHGRGHHRGVLMLHPLRHPERVHHHAMTADRSHHRLMHISVPRLPIRGRLATKRVDNTMPSSDLLLHHHLRRRRARRMVRVMWAPAGHHGASLRLGHGLVPNDVFVNVPSVQMVCWQCVHHA